VSLICAQHDVQRIERKNTFLPSRLCSPLIAELRGQNVRRADFDSAAITAMAAAAYVNLAAGCVAEIVFGFQRHIAASTGSRRIVTFGGDLGIRTQRQLIGSNQFDDAIMIFHGVGLNETVLVHHPGVQGIVPPSAMSLPSLSTDPLGSVTCMLMPRPSGRSLNSTVCPPRGNGAARRLNAAVVFKSDRQSKC